MKIGGITLENKKNNAEISVKSFITAVIILGLLMIATYFLTFLIPSGEYQRILSNGEYVIVPNTYSTISGGISFIKWLLSPILALTAEGGITIISISIFLLIIGGVFYVLDSIGILSYMLYKITSKYSDKKYKLLCIISFFFMTMGSCIGSFEECVPLVPLAVALAYSLGWDALVGLGMSILSAGLGFATGICNPFSVGVAQELAGLPMFSGISFRLISFAIVYIILISFLILYCKKLDKTSAKSLDETAATILSDDTNIENSIAKDKAIKSFITIMGIGILLIVISPFIPVLQDIIMPIIALCFLMAGISTAYLAGASRKVFISNFVKGVIGILPAILLILMASSIKYTMTEAKVMDTIMYYATNIIESTPKGQSIILVYVFILIMNLFIGSGSAKAFLLIPLIAPLVDIAGISRQLAVLAFTYGDGFSNLLYPTNPVLLISLGLAGVSYSKWFKWIYKLQIIIFVVTSILLLIALKVGY